jgi:Spx/MgsR family transcriptional regulator
MIIYGIKNCDTIRKARKWLTAHKIEYEFHDFRSEGINPIQLRAWAAEAGWQKLLNKRSTTWRNLPDETKTAIDETLAIFLMEENPTLIKRPVLEMSAGILVGFSEKIYTEKLLS